MRLEFAFWSFLAVSCTEVDLAVFEGRSESRQPFRDQVCALQPQQNVFGEGAELFGFVHSNSRVCESWFCDLNWFTNQRLSYFNDPVVERNSKTTVFRTNQSDDSTSCV